jgi:hypothetical protein
VNQNFFLFPHSLNTVHVCCPPFFITHQNSLRPFSCQPWLWLWKCRDNPLKFLSSGTAQFWVPTVQGRTQFEICNGLLSDKS